MKTRSEHPLPQMPQISSVFPLSLMTCTRASWGKQKYVGHLRHLRQVAPYSRVGRAMTTADLRQLRSVLALRRDGLIDRLATDGSGVIEPAFVSLLADTHTAIVAVDAELAEFVTAGGVS